MNSVPRFRSALAIAAAAAVLVVAGIVFVNSGLVSQTTSSVTQTSPLPIVGKIALTCDPSHLSLTGLLLDCASTLEGMGCPRGSFEAPRVVHLRGSTGDYILYLEVDGGYQGPGAYQLTPWKKDTLNGDDNVAKVAVREWDSGRLWESYSGTITIDSSEEGGRVEADLRLPGKSSSPIVHIAGPWTCP